MNIDKMEKLKYVYFINFSRWKRSLLTPFIPEIKNSNAIFYPESRSALVANFKITSKVYIWGNESCSGLKENINNSKLNLKRVEDGFIRSVSLGVDFSQPYSLVIDSKGIYYDPNSESDLEYILLNQKFDKSLIDRAKRLREYLVKNRLSKYNIYKNKSLSIDAKGKKVLLVVGQVEGDASLVYGANNMRNIELLKEVKAANPNSYIIYKAHPDVLSGSRKGDIEDKEALRYCDRVEKDVSIDTLLSICDEVHTMTSLVGFEALLRSKKVVCYGMPFYAGWGLTIDKKKCKRRDRKLSIDELVAGAYILYPKYIHPKTLEPCEVEDLLYELSIQKERYHNSYFYRSYIKISNFFRKKYYALLRHTIYRGKV